MSNLKTDNAVIIASYTSWYHLTGIMSFVSGNKINPRKTMLLDNIFLGRKRSINNKVITDILGECQRFDNYEDINSQVKEIDSNCLIYVISTSNKPYKLTWELRRRSIPYTLVVVEEGIGSYGTAIQNISAKMRENNHEGVRRHVFLLEELVKEGLKSLIFLRKEKVYWTNYNKNKLTLNHNVVNAYKKEVVRQSKIQGVDQNMIARINCGSLFLSSPVVELGLIAEKDYIWKLKSIIRKDRKLYVKPHPAEDDAKYKRHGFNLIKSDLPFEIIAIEISQLVPVYALSSTCCYTANLFSNISIVRLEELDFFYKSLSRKQKKILSGLPSSYINYDNLWSKE